MAAVADCIWQMAAVAETSFSALLSADSENPLPDPDKDVVAALNEYGVTFAKNKPVPFQIFPLEPARWLAVAARAQGRSLAGRFSRPAGSSFGEQLSRIR